MGSKKLVEANDSSDSADFTCFTVYRCRKCKQTFKRETDLKRHNNTLHLRTNIHQCHVCKKQFTRKDYLTNHLLTHNRSEADYVECKFPSCGRRILKASLRHHSRQYHCRTSLACAWCMISCTSKSNLTAHIQRKHPERSSKQGILVAKEKGNADTNVYRSTGTITTSSRFRVAVHIPTEKFLLRVRNVPERKRQEISLLRNTFDGKQEESKFYYEFRDKGYSGPFKSGIRRIWHPKLLHNETGSVVVLLDLLQLLRPTEGLNREILDYYLQSKFGKNDAIVLASLNFVSQDEHMKFNTRHTVMPEISSSSKPLIVPINVPQHFAVLVYDKNFTHCHVLDSYWDRSTKKEHAKYLKGLKAMSDGIIDIVTDVKNFHNKVKVIHNRVVQQSSDQEDKNNCAVYICYFIKEIVEHIEKSSLTLDNDAECVIPNTLAHSLDKRVIQRLRLDMFHSILGDVKKYGTQRDFVK